MNFKINIKVDFRKIKVVKNVQKKHKIHLNGDRHLIKNEILLKEIISDKIRN